MSSSTIGKYQILETLGQGAMGVVYKAQDPDIERLVAIKTLHAQQNDSAAQELLGRFKQEAQAAAKCTHPNIVAVLEYGEHEGSPYIVMEYVEGKSLEDIIAQSNSLNLTFIMNVLSQMFKALNEAHAANIVHRDIKPSNIMIMENSSVKLADFGIARLPTNNKLTQVGMTIGTPKYMAPEQAMGLPVDKRTDIFALTMVLLDLLSLLPQNTGIAYDYLPEIRGLLPNNQINYQMLLPAPLIPVLTRGLAVNPDERYPNIKSYAQDVQRILPQLKNIKAGSNPNLKATVRMATQGTEARTSHLGSIQGSSFGHDTHLSTGESSSLMIDLMTLAELKQDYQKVKGDDAHDIIREEMSDVISLSELIHALANRIDNKRKRKKFLQTWQQ